MKKNDHSDERFVIVNFPEKRPYGLHAIFNVSDFEVFKNDCSIFLDSGAYVTITQSDKSPWDSRKEYSAKLEGFNKMQTAAIAGRHLIQAFLETALRLNFSLKFVYNGLEPVRIYDRNATHGACCNASVHTILNQQNVVDVFRKSYSNNIELSEKTLLSMELFCSAKTETTQRSKFIGLISALEPLAECQKLDADIQDYIDSCIVGLDNITVQADLKQSLVCRFRELKSDSIRRSIKKLVFDTIKDDGCAAKLIDTAYNIRSQMLHSGHPKDEDIQLDDEILSISNIIKQIYLHFLDND